MVLKKQCFVSNLSINTLLLEILASFLHTFVAQIATHVSNVEVLVISGKPLDSNFRNEAQRNERTEVDGAPFRARS